MKKSVLNLNGAKELTKNEQKNVYGSNKIMPSCTECNAGDCLAQLHLPVCIKKSHLL